MSPALQIFPGVKTDPIHYRYSYAWLFDLMAQEGVHDVQFGTFVELYHLGDGFFEDVRRQAEGRGLKISSVFTSHRELGSFFIDAPDMEKVGRRNFERLIEVGALLGAVRVGTNPGAADRDRIEEKAAGLRRYVHHLKELMGFAHEKKIECLTIEPMSCLAEPPTLPEEIVTLADELTAYHRDTPETAAVGYCADVSHGYADAEGKVVHDPMKLFEATIPYLREFHVRNTDAKFESTFGFSPADRARGIVDLAQVRACLERRASDLPTPQLVAYLEIGGPKLGRDYSDPNLGPMLRESLQHMREVLCLESRTDM